MKKTTKTPGIYDNLAAPSKTVAARMVIIDDAGQVHVLPSNESRVPLDVIIDTQFKDMDDFMKRGAGTIRAYHAKFLGAEIPKGVEVEQAAFMTWAWFVKNGKPILDGTVKAETGEKERKSSIGECLYMRGESKDSTVIVTAQAKVCWSLFERCIEARPHVKEAELRQFVEANAAELKTKQDPWRIFQYYRPKLIEAKLLRRQ